jgi:hypothetical protein
MIIISGFLWWLSYGGEGDASTSATDAGYLGSEGRRNTTGSRKAISAGFSALGRARQEAMGAVGVLITMIQINVTIPLNIDVDWPDAIVDLCKTLSFFNVDFGALFGSFACAGDYDFYYLLDHSFVICSVMVFFMPAVLLLVRFFDGLKGGTLIVPGSRVDRFQDYVWSIFIFASFLVFPGITATTFRTFKCQTLAGHSYLATDLSLSCEDALHDEYVGRAMYGVIVFTVGIPATFLYLLRTSHRKGTLQADKKNVKRIGFLYTKYREEVWYWELIEMMRKFMLMTVVIFISGQSAAKIVFAMTISFVILLVHVSVREMKSSWVNKLQTISLVSTFVLLWGALILRTGIDGTAYDIVVALYLWIPIVVIFGVILAHLVMSIKRCRKAMRKCCCYKSKALVRHEAKVAPIGKSLHGEKQLLGEDGALVVAPHETSEHVVREKRGDLVGGSQGSVSFEVAPLVEDGEGRLRSGGAKMKIEEVCTKAPQKDEGKQG